MTMLHEKCKISHIVLNINNIQEYVFCKRDCFKMYIADYVVHVKSELKVTYSVLICFIYTALKMPNRLPRIANSGQGQFKLFLHPKLINTNRIMFFAWIQNG